MSSPPFSEYPRDLAGYGRNPPDPHWPGKARVAVQFVVNFEEGAENSILHGDQASESFLTEVIGTHPGPRPRVRRFQPARTQSKGGCRHARSWLGHREPRPEMDRLQGLFLRRRNRAY